MPPIKRQIRLVTFVYWFLLIYVVAALTWWFISLEEQNDQLANAKLEQLSITIDKQENSALYTKIEKGIHKAQLRKTYQYIGEGLTFLIIIFIGATFVYNIVRKRLKLSQQQKNFMMAVTHELKTPIAVAKLNLETLLKRKLEGEQQQRLINNALQETNRLNDLCSNILVSAQLEGGAYKSHKISFNLSMLLTDISKDFNQQFPNRNLQYSIAPDINIYGETLLIQLMINNFIENAIKYSPAATLVHVELKKNERKALITIADQGSGIPDEEKSKIWEKFYRVGNENTRNTKGTGIGLYLCRIIARDHRATLSITNNIPTGSIFTVQFPITE